MTKEKKKGGWRHAFAFEKAEDFNPSEEDLAVLDAVALRISRHGMSIPGILFLESARPMNFIGAQAMAFFEPIVRTVFSQWDGYSKFYKIMERRGSVECLIERIEIYANQRQELIEKSKAEKKNKKRRHNKKAPDLPE